jgi:NAD(P)-dependent dehydrogenase (short-subunit alcohol dehydrogenase family)
MSTILIIGATRGLGASLANAYANDSSNVVFGTTRSAHSPGNSSLSDNIHWVPHIDLGHPGVGARLVNQLGMLGGGGGMVDGGVKGFDIVVRSINERRMVKALLSWNRL